jgi:hypothetical protein
MFLEPLRDDEILMEGLGEDIAHNKKMPLALQSKHKKLRSKPSLKSGFKPPRKRQSGPC